MNKLNQIGLENYNKSYGNYKSDKHKSRNNLFFELQFLLHHLELPKKDLIDLRDIILNKVKDK